jgi:recombination protein RecA
MPPTKKSKPAEKKASPSAGTSTALALVAPTIEHQAALFGPLPEESMGKGEKFDRKKEIEALSQQVNKAFKGGAVIRQGSEITNVFMLRRPSGVTSLDLKIGGGVPAGGLTQIIGRYSAGKSYLVNCIMAEAQRNYGEEFAASANMTEQRFDKHFAKWKCGLRIALSDDEIEVLRVINRNNGMADFTPEQVAWLKDQVGTFTEVVGATAEQILEVACQQIESNLFQIVLIDSFGALLTKAEAEAEEGLEQKHRSGAAGVVTQFMHRLHAALNLPDKYGRPNTTSVIGINQYRDNMGKDAQWNPMKVAGGHALAHGKLLDIHVEQGARIKHPISKNDIKIVGKEIHWEIMKGKAGCHDGPRGTYKFYFGEHGFGFGIDVYSDLLVAGLETAVVQQKGAYYYFEGDTLGQGEAQVAHKLHSNPELLQKIRKEVFKVAGLSFITREGI